MVCRCPVPRARPRPIFRALVVLAAALAAAPALVPAAPERPLLSWGVDLASSYVDRGADLFTGVYRFDEATGSYEKEHEPFNPSPAFQPSLTFYGPGGLFFGLWGSFALTNRDPADGDLAALDEVDYTLAWAWENRLGSFEAGLANYAAVPARGAASEVYLVWGLPLAAGLAPTLTHYSDTASAASYTSLAVGGGEAFTWGLNVGYGQTAEDPTTGRSEGGIQDVTLSLGYGLGESLSVAFNASYRPTPDLVGYDKDGKYTVGGEEKDYPPAIFWLTLSAGGEVQ